MDNENESAGGKAISKAGPFSGPGFMLGAVMGVFMIWGIGRFSEMGGGELTTFYRNSYIVFLGITSAVYYKRIKL